MALLVKGNTKLGRHIWHWSLPAVKTCPGRTALCESVCYAIAGNYNWDSVKKRLARNLTLSRKSGFVEKMIAECRLVSVVRIHASGDFYDAAYVTKWRGVASACPGTKFYCYTRSWRVPEMAAELEKLSRLRNVRVWYSADREAAPVRVPRRVRVAYLQDQDPGEGESADLLFRTKPLRPAGKVLNLPLVCPAETPTGHERGANCSDCGVCWR